MPIIVAGSREAFSKRKNVKKIFFLKKLNIVTNGTNQNSN